MKNGEFMMKFVFAATSLFMISACTIFNPNNGQDVAHNTTQQTIDAYAGFEDSVATLDGAKAEKLLNEYRTEGAEAPKGSLLEDIGN